MSNIKTRNKRIELLRFYSGNGKTIEQACSLIGVKKATAKQYAKTWKIPFPDYNPGESL